MVAVNAMTEKVPLIREGLQTYPKIIIYSTEPSYFFQNNYTVLFNNLAGNPTDYKSYNVLNNISLTPFLEFSFQIDIFQSDGLTQSNGPCILVYSTNTSLPQDPSGLGLGQISGTAVETLSSVLDINETVTSQSNNGYSFLGSAYRVRTTVAELPVEQLPYYRLNNGDVITFFRASGVEGNIFVRVNGYNVHSVPIPSTLATPFTALKMVKRNDQVIRLTKITQPLVPIVTLPRINPSLPFSNPEAGGASGTVTIHTSAARFAGGATTQTFNFGNPLDNEYCFYTFLPRFGTGFANQGAVCFYYESFYRGTTTPWDKPIRFALLGSNWENGGPSLSDTTESQWQTFANNTLYEGNMYTLSQSNNPNDYSSCVHEYWNTISHTVTRFTGRYFTLNNGDYISFIPLGTPQNAGPGGRVIIAVNGYYIIYVQPTFVTNFQTMGMWQRKNQTINLTLKLS